tara:strand:- start:94663 stop:95787 length:1125 start_codon:yes stop_codon:yes gene_type:complete
LKRIANVTRQLVKTTGAARNTLEQTRLFHNLGWEVHVFGEFVNKNNIKESGGIPHKIFTLPLSNYKRRLQFAKSTGKKLEKGNFDLIFGHGEIFDQDVLFLHNCVHLANELVKGRPLPEDHPVGQIHKKILTEQKFKLVVCNSDLMKKDLAQRYSIPESKLVTIHPGFSPEQFNLNKAEQLRDQFRSEQNLTDEVLIGLITSGNFEKRNVDVFIQACAHLPTDLKNKCKFLVVGKGPDNGWDRKLVNELNESDRFIFIEPIPQIEKIYHGVDIQVLPAKWEEFGRVVPEGMTCKNPVIVSHQVGSSDLLEGESRDLILNPVTAESLTQKLLSLIENEDLRHRIGEINRTTAAKYSEEEQGKKLKATLLEYGLID